MENDLEEGWNWVEEPLLDSDKRVSIPFDVTETTADAMKEG